ncbi:MAG: DegT/DnrJ/EryC1/StrS family aminotransferase [Candidatus Omnitrophota bacterium]
MNIPFSDLGIIHKKLRIPLNKALERVIARGDFILGEDVRLFEQEFASVCNARYGIGTSSGTAALFLSLVSLGIGAGDEVIVPDFTFIATAFAVTYTGAKPVFADIDDVTYNIDVKKIKHALSRKTKAIIPVHLYGQPAAMRQIMQLAGEYDLKVIEDAAQAHGALCQVSGKKLLPVGSIGDIGCFSFYPSKNLGGFGDGGMIVTNDEALYRKLLVLRDCGRISKYEHAVVGYNSRLDTLQAALLREKLKYLNAWTRLRKAAAERYDAMLKDVPGVIIPRAVDQASHVYHVYAIRIKNRDAVVKKLQEKGIGVIVHYPIPLHMQKVYASLGYKKGDFPVAEQVSREIVSLPLYPYMKPSQIKYVVRQIRAAVETAG